VAGNSHRDGSGNPAILQAPASCPAQIVKQEPWHLAEGARGRSRFSKVADLAALEMEHVRTRRTFDLMALVQIAQQ